MQVLKRISLVALIIGICVVGAIAQTKAPARTITNLDLEKYRQARVAADDDYRKTYEQRGLPSPEELERREDERQKRLAELSAQLQQQRLQAEYYDYLKSLAGAQYANSTQPQLVYLNNGSGINGFTTGGYFYVNQYGNQFRGRPVRGTYYERGTGFGPNVRAVRDQAGMFPNTSKIGNSPRDTRINQAQPIFSPRP